MKDKLTKLRDILSGKTPIALNLEFLYTHNKADLQVCWHRDCKPGYAEGVLGVWGGASWCARVQLKSHLVL
jgi:hypothetical protein